MKLIKIVTCLLFSLCCFSLTYAINSEVHDEGKIYLKKEDLHITDKAIFLIVGQNAIPLQNLAVDEGGIYFDQNKMWGWGWQCPNCFYINGESFNTCQRCHKPRP